MDPTLAAAIKRGNPVVFMDIEIANQPMGRIKIELFKTIAPKVFFIIIQYNRHVKILDNFVQVNLEDLIYLLVIRVVHFIV